MSKIPNLRTANQALVRELMAAASAPEYDKTPQLRHGLITTANASLFTEAHFSEPLTTYAIGWRDTARYDVLSDFIAPPLEGNSELYEHIEYPNAEAFLSDDAPDDLRPIGGDFKTVEMTSTKDRRQVPNRGLRMVVDIDKVKNEPNWQETRVNRLMGRLARNAARRKVALAIAAATAQALIWDAAGNADPDLDVAKQAKLAGDSSGITPNRALWGVAAKLSRYQTYGATNTAKAVGGRNLSPEEACQKMGLQALVDDSRYQNGASKSTIVGSLVLLFNAYGQSGEDPSNFKTARANTMQGGRFAVYIRQLGVKFWEVIVECYETEFCATTLGCRVLNITES